MKKNILSKSTFIRGLQCHKSVYLYKNRYFLRDKLSAEQQAKFRRGTNVGKLAQQLFPGGIDVSPPTPFQYAKAVEQTRQLVSENHPVIYEASFSFNGVLAALDILEYKDGKWYAWEVKSSLTVSDTYIMDAALQYYIITNCGINLADFTIIHMNAEYVLEGQLEIKKLFCYRSVLEEVRNRQQFIADEINAQLQVVTLSKSPAIDIGPHCNKPYPCDFQGHCWKHIPEDSIFDLQWLSQAQKFELYSGKITNAQNIPDDFITDPNQAIKLKAHKTATPFIDRTFLSKYVSAISFPLCLLKVWYQQPAVPLFEGTRPYQKFPVFAGFAWLEKPESDPVYTFVFFEPDFDPRKRCEEALGRFLSIGSAIITYNDPAGDWFRQLAGKYSNTSQEMHFDLYSLFEDCRLYFPETSGNNDLLKLGNKIFENLVEPGKIYNTEAEALLDYPETGSNKEKSQRYIEKMEQTSRLNLEALRALLQYIWNNQGK